MRVRKGFLRSRKNWAVMAALLALGAWASPPEARKHKIAGAEVTGGEEMVLMKRLRVSEQESNPGVPEREEQGEAPRQENREEYDKVKLQIGVLLSKYDYIASLFYTSDRRRYRRREKEYIRQIQVNMFRMAGGVPITSRSSVSYLIGNVYSDSIREFRRELVRALSFVKINLFEQAADACSVVDEALEGVRIYDIVSMPEDQDEQSVAAEGDSSTGSEVSWPSSGLDGLEEDSLELDGTDWECNFPESEDEGPEAGPPDIQSLTDGINRIFSRGLGPGEPKRRGAAEGSASGEGTSSAAPAGQFEFNTPARSRAYREDDYVAQRVQSVQRHYLGRDAYGNDLRASDLKTFLSHISEGFMPRIAPGRSKLARALTASVVIMQETGILDQLMEDYGVRNVRTKFLMDTLFEQKPAREPYRSDPRGAEQLQLGGIHEYKKFRRAKRRVHPHMSRGAEELERAAIDFALATFPEVRDDIGVFQDMKNFDVDELPYLCDLESVLAKRELVVLVHPREYGVFTNFSSRRTDSLHRSILAAALSILHRRYIGARGRRIEIVYRRSSDPVLDLVRRKGHMTGLYFVMDETLPSETLFGSRVETLGIPLLAHGAHIMVHKRHGVKSIEDWHRFIDNPPCDNRIIVTNFAKRALFQQGVNFKVVSIVLDSHKDAPVHKMAEFNPVAGVFWGINPNNYLISDYYLVEFPYGVIQGPYFSAR